MDKPEITEEEIALLLEHGELTPELEELIQQYRETTAPPEQTLLPIGSYCTIPFTFEQYELVLLPAIILKHDTSTTQVMMMQPVTVDTSPCPAYFVYQTPCQKDCDLSHGYRVPTDQILPYEALEKTSVEHFQYGKKVWCHVEGDVIWKLGNIIDQLHGPRWRVRLKDKSKKRVTVDLEHIKPFQSLDDHSVDEEQEEWSESDMEPDVAEGERLYASKASLDCGSWQEHTTGFGLKMMKKMGYVEGHGLGLDGTGRIDPISAYSGQQDTRRGLGFQKKTKKQDTRPTKETVSDSVFDFTNALLETDKAVSAKETTVQKPELKDRKQTTKTLSKLQADLEYAQKEHHHALEAFRRNKGSPMEKQFSEKLKSASIRHDQAKKQLTEVSNHVKKEKEKKAMYTF